MQKFWRNLVFWYFERYHFRQGIRGTFEVGGDGALAGLAVPPAPPPELLPGHDGGAGWPGAGEGWAGPEQDAGPVELESVIPIDCIVELRKPILGYIKSDLCKQR